MHIFSNVWKIGLWLCSPSKRVYPSRLRRVVVVTLIIKSGEVFLDPLIENQHFQNICYENGEYGTSYVQLRRYFHIYWPEENIKNRFRSKATGRNPVFDFHISKDLQPAMFMNAVWSFMLAKKRLARSKAEE